MISTRLVADYLIRESKRDLKDIVEREVKVILVGKNKGISIIGPRRSGKTYFLYKLREKLKLNFMHIEFDNVVFKGIKAEEMFDVISIYKEVFGVKPEVIFLDEIQALEDWPLLVRSLLDSGEYFIFLSGSSSKLLSKEIATQLRGRTISYFVFPFSFREFLTAKKVKIKKFYSLDEEAEIKRKLREYMEYGAYPEVVLNDDIEVKEKVLREYFETTFYKDYVERFGLKNIGLARTLFEFMFQNFSSEFSVKKFINIANVRASKNTVYEYAEYLPETLDIFFVEKYSKSVYERKSWPKKIYVCDVGISKILGFDTEIGRKMENVVFLDLFVGKNENPLREINFYKSKKGHEVDFVVREGAKIKQLIQVSYISTEQEINKREIKALLEASKELSCENLIVITWDYECEKKINEKIIKFIPLWKWLLTKEMSL
jgi:predicted AAA+ superfamily ATPase